ncbi:hypothetical protein FMM75_01720 [Lachnospiraceae bacterium MD335]|nr:hypothetical protein [Lachnospiraceae bacterium MD335]
MNMRQLFVQKFKLITVLGGREWARHPVEPFRTDIINRLANILINLIKRKQYPRFPRLITAKTVMRFLQLNKDQGRRKDFPASTTRR